MEASIQQFAIRHNVRLRKDSCGDMIAGKPPKPRAEDRSHTFETGSGKLGLCLLLESPKAWTYAKRRLLAAGFELRQDGATEGTLLFDPNDDLQCRQALKTGGIRVKRRLAPEERAKMANRLAEARKGRFTLPAEVAA